MIPSLATYSVASKLNFKTIGKNAIEVQRKPCEGVDLLSHYVLCENNVCINWSNLKLFYFLFHF